MILVVTDDQPAGLDPEPVRRDAVPPAPSARPRRPLGRVRERVREHAALLPVSCHDADGAVRPPHRRSRTTRTRSWLDETSTLATWLHDEGYHTGLVGKYLNRYPFERTAYVPAGWDRWWGRQYGPATSLYFDYTLFEQDHLVPYGHTDADYATDVLADKATEFIREAPADQPFFLWFASDRSPPALDRGAEGRGGVRRPRGSDAALGRRGRCDRQAGLGPRPRPARRRGTERRSGPAIVVRTRRCSRSTTRSARSWPRFARAVSSPNRRDLHVGQRSRVRRAPVDQEELSLRGVHRACRS